MYDDICNFKNLIAAYKEARKCKRFKVNIVDFGYYLESNLLRIQRELLDETYLPSPYVCFTVYDPKTRKVAAPAFRDRVMQHSLVSRIEPHFDSQFIYDSYACRRDRGTHFGMARIKRFLQAARSKYGKQTHIYCLRMDVKKFFASVSWDVLLTCVNKTIKCEKTRKLIEKIVTKYKFFNLKGKFIDPPPDVVVPEKRQGLPIGNLTSQLFANIYLNQLDHFVKETLKIKWYARYMDDFLVIHPDKNYLRQIRNDIKTFLEYELKLQLHPKKVIIHDVNQGIPFVGYRIFYDHVLIRGKTLVRMRKKLKLRKLMIEKGDDDFSIEACLCSIREHLNRADAFGLQNNLFNVLNQKTKIKHTEQLRLFQ